MRIDYDKAPQQETTIYSEASVKLSCEEILDVPPLNWSRSCPPAWCKKLGLITAFTGLWRVGQVTMAGRPTRLVWLNEVIVSSVM